MELLLATLSLWLRQGCTVAITLYIEGWGPSLQVQNLGILKSTDPECADVVGPPVYGFLSTKNPESFFSLKPKKS